MVSADAPARTILGIDTDPRKLPLIVARAIRRQEYQPAEKQALLELANLVREHAGGNYNVDNLETLLAAAVSAQPFSVAPASDGRRKSVAFDIHEMSHYMLAVPRAWNNPLLHDAPSATRSASLLLDRAKKQVAEDRRGRDLNHGGQDGAFNAIRAAVTAAAELHPELGLTFGYIGGVHTWGDDRSYKVFAKLATPDCHLGCNISFGGFGHDRIGEMLISMEKHFARWLEQVLTRLAAGEIRQVGGWLRAREERP